MKTKISPFFTLAIWMALYLGVGGFFGGLHPILGVLVGDGLMIFAPAVYLHRKWGFKLATKPVKGRTWVEVGLLILWLFPLCTLLNGLYLELVGDFLPEMYRGEGLLQGGYSLPFKILLLGLFPAVTEEFFFRDILLRFLRSYGLGLCVLLSGVIFSLFHFDLHNVLAPFILGVVLSQIYLYGGSYPLVVAGHFFYNSLGIIFLHFYTPEARVLLERQVFVQALGGLERAMILLLVLLTALGLYLLSRYSLRLVRRPRVHLRKLSPQDLFWLFIIVSMYFRVTLPQSF
ncbi:MAG: type II CAAX endopeptidase family protein [Tissierellia bacterium]|nr:type II CAAX endopeptidase family protein [Tissierellia bacterium]